MNTEEDEFRRIEREIVRRALPDPIHHADTSETLEYVYGWNDCRQSMLEQQEPVHCEAGPKYCQQCHKEAMKLALEALRKSRSRIVEQGGSGWKLYAQQCVNASTALQEALAEQPAQQKPVYHPRQYGDVIGTKEVRTLQAQPKREFVGLTDEEIAHIADSEWEEAFVRMIEAKLKEKNNENSN